MGEPMSYVYAITRDPDPSLIQALEGIAGSAVRLVDVGGLAALVSTVDYDEFGEQGLRKNLEHLDWLEKTVREHNQVVDSAAAAFPVAPLGLATVYYNDDRVRSCLQERADAFTEVLDQIAGRTEWGVKAYAEPQPSAPVGEPVAAAEAPERPGTAYLHRLRERRQSQDQSKQEAVERAGAIHEHLCKLADACRVHPPQNRELAHYTGLMVPNGAYLVDDTRSEEFTAAVHHVANETPGLRVELTGPWPAYSFAVVRDEEER